MSRENALLMEFSNDVEKCEIEVTKMSQNNPLFFTVIPLWLPPFTWVGPALHFDFTLTIIDNSYCMLQCFGCMAISCSLIQRTIDHMLKGKSCLDFDSFHKKPVLIARNSRSACETIVSISCSTAWTDELQVVKSLMTIAPAWCHKTNPLYIISGLSLSILGYEWDWTGVADNPERPLHW